MNFGLFGAGLYYGYFNYVVISTFMINFINIYHMYWGKMYTTNIKEIWIDYDLKSVHMIYLGDQYEHVEISALVNKFW